MVIKQINTTLIKYSIVLYSIFFCILGCNPTITKGQASVSEIELSLDSLYLAVSKTDSLNLLARKTNLLEARQLLLKSNSPKIIEHYNKWLSYLFKEKAYVPYLKLNNDLREKGVLLRDTLLLYKSEKNIGNYHYFISQKLDSAYSGYYNSAIHAESIDSLRNAGFSYLSMGIIQKNESDFIGAEHSTVKALEYLSEFDEPRYIASCHNNLGLIARQVDQADRAIGYFEKAVLYRDQIKDNDVVQAGSYNNMGITYAQKANYDQAISYYNQGLQIKNLLQRSPKTYARLLHNKSRAQFYQGHRLEILSDMERAYKMRDSLGDRLGMATSALHLGEYYLSINDTVNARLFFEKAMSESRVTKYMKGYLNSLLNLSKVSNPVAAKTHLNRHIHLSDSLLMRRRSLQDYFARTRYETAQFQEQVGVLSITAKRYKTAIYVFLISVIVFLLGFIRQLRKDKKRELAFQTDQTKAGEEMYNLVLSQNIKIQDARAQEKERISKELHDGVLSKLFGVRLSLDMLNTKTTDESIAQREAYLEELKDIGQEIRKISHDLQDDTFLIDTSFVEFVGEYIKEQCKRLQLGFTYIFDENYLWDSIPINTKVNLYRILQESIINIGKHAHAQHINVEFIVDQKKKNLLIKDDGEGINNKKITKGIGFRNMKARAVAIPGKLIIHSVKGEGTTIKIQF